ncbi:RNA dependent RNA polymerase, partial [Mycobacterium kansasii]
IALRGMFFYFRLIRCVLHFGNIHVATATYIGDLENVVGNFNYAIFFPTKEPRSLADEMTNNAFDGDMYWVSRNPNS